MTFCFLGLALNMSEAKRVPSMGKDDKNFRSKLIEKVGIRGVEERKTLEKLWQEDPLNVDKITNFALEYSLPTCERLQVWKVILGKFSIPCDAWLKRLTSKAFSKKIILH